MDFKWLLDFFSFVGKGALAIGISEALAAFIVFYNVDRETKHPVYYGVIALLAFTMVEGLAWLVQRLFLSWQHPIPGIVSGITVAIIIIVVATIMRRERRDNKDEPPLPPSPAPRNDALRWGHNIGDKSATVSPTRGEIRAAIYGVSEESFREGGAAFDPRAYGESLNREKTPKGHKQLLDEKMKSIADKARVAKTHAHESQEIQRQLFEERLHWLEVLAEKNQGQWKAGQYEEDRGEAMPMQVDHDGLRNVGGGLGSLLNEVISSDLPNSRKEVLSRRIKNVFDSSVRPYIESHLGWCYQYTPSDSTEWKNIIELNNKRFNA